MKNEEQRLLECIKVLNSENDEKSAIKNEYKEIQIRGIRKIIGDSMAHSLTEIPQLTHNLEFDASQLLKVRKIIKTNYEEYGLEDININHMILFAVSRVLLKYPNLNANVVDGYYRLYKNVNLGVAVATKRGLLVPVIVNANNLSLNDIAKRTNELAKRANTGRIDPGLLSGGTFTVSNLGNYGITSFTPIINPPETGILGVCKLMNNFEIMEERIVPYKSINLSLTYDHRAIDGAPASLFLQDLGSVLENFGNYLEDL